MRYRRPDILKANEVFTLNNVNEFGIFTKDKFINVITCSGQSIIFGDEQVDPNTDVDFDPYYLGTLGDTVIWNEISNKYEAIITGDTNRQTHADVDSFVDPVIGLARTMYDNGYDLHWAKNGYGGTSMQQWVDSIPVTFPYNFDGDISTSSLYKSAWFDFAGAIKTAFQLTPNVTIGHIWRQGQSDAMSNPSQSDYYDKEYTYLMKFRSDIYDLCGIYPYILNSTLPTTAEYAAGDGAIPRPYADLVNAAKTANAARIPNCYLVSEAGLPRIANHVHYTSMGMVELGIRDFKVLVENNLIKR